MKTKPIAVITLAAVLAAGGAFALANTAKRAVPGASIGRHYMRRTVDRHAAYHPVRRKPVVPPPQ